MLTQGNHRALLSAKLYQLIVFPRTSNFSSTLPRDAHTGHPTALLQTSHCVYYLRLLLPRPPLPSVRTLGTKLRSYRAFNDAHTGRPTVSTAHTSMTMRRF